MATEIAPGEGAYANPQPYADPQLERNILAGRIAFARNRVESYRQSGDLARAASWNTTLDRLLDHYNAADERAITKAMEA